jgi:hypothetical protein
MKLTELRKLLTVGVEFDAEAIGGMNTRVLSNLGVTSLKKPDSEIFTRRRVVKQTAREMVTVYLSGPKEGREIHCDWKGVKARQFDGGDIILTMTDNGREEDFLRIWGIQ